MAPAKKKPTTSIATADPKDPTQGIETTYQRTATFEVPIQQVEHASANHNLRSNKIKATATLASHNQQIAERSEQQAEKELATVLTQLKNLEKAKGKTNAEAEERPMAMQKRQAA